MVEFLHSLIASVDDSSIVELVVSGLVVLFFSGLVGLISKPVASGLMISLGIFGTFWGILIALEPLDFSPEKMNDSVKALLDGMKTAFYTSLYGMGAAIFSKLLWDSWPYKRLQSFVLNGIGKIFSKPGEAIDPVHKDMNERLDAIRKAISGDGNDSLVTQIQKLRDENRTGLESADNRLEAIKQVIAGDGDSSLVTQMQKLRDENRDGFQKLDGLAETIRETLVKNLQETMEKLAADLKEVIADQLGGQLKKLIDDINKALVEQFGKTFVEFNQAVQALKKWQEDHREQVEQLTAAFDESAKGIAQIKDDCSVIPPTMEKLQQAVVTANAQVQELDERLGAFADMKKQAEESFPTIKENLDKIGEDLQKSASGFHQMEQLINDSVNSIAQTMRSRIEEMQSGVSEAIQLAVRESTAAINHETETMKGNMQNAQVQLNSVIEETVKKALDEFNRRITGEIEVMTREWGQNLTSIARECADVITTIRNQ